MSDLIACDMVAHGDKQFLVSTVNRGSSAILAPDRYAETLVWEWHADRPAEDRRGKIVGQDEAGQDSFAGHKRMCTMFEAHGKQLDEDEAAMLATDAAKKQF